MYKSVALVKLSIPSFPNEKESLKLKFPKSAISIFSLVESTISFNLVG